MKFKLSTILISVFLVGLLLYGFVSLTSNDPYGDYAPGTELSIANTNGTADTTTPGNWPYPVAWNFNYSGIANVNGGTVGACYYADKYWCNRWNAANVYLFANSGTNGGPGGAPTTITYTGSIRDMGVAPDGSGSDFIWGGKASTTLYKFSPTGTTLGTYSVPQQMRAFVWDPNRKGFWAANWATDIKCFDTTGAIKDTYAGGLALAGKYGMGWDSGHAHVDTATLFIWHQTPGQTLTEVNITTKTTIRSFLISAGTNSAGGAEVYQSSVNNDMWLVLNYQNYANIAYKIGTSTPTLTVPEVLYYTFDETGGDSTKNYAIPGSGAPWAQLVGTGQTIAGTGQWGNALNGTGTSSGTDYVNTGWTTNIGTSSWTISVWLKDITVTFGYLFGDNTAASWRSFLNGAAGTNNIILRGGGMTDLIVTGVVPGPNVVTFVYDSAAGQTRGYKNGVLVNTKTQSPLNINGTAPFKVGGYSTSAGLLGKLDEFRLYNRALTDAEVAAAWNHQFIISGIKPVLNIIPEDYTLSQNYPNPFNPTTTIDFKVPVNGLVTLKVYDVTGKEVKTLVNEVVNAGVYTVDFNASNLSSGVYFYKILAGDYMDVKKMVLLK